MKLRITGTHQGELIEFPESGKTVDFRVMTICTIRDDKIIEQAGLSDNLTLFVQLGMIEMPAPMTETAA